MCCSSPGHMGLILGLYWGYTGLLGQYYHIIGLYRAYPGKCGANEYTQYDTSIHMYLQHSASIRAGNMYASIGWGSEL